jgi:hypothetical protein
MAFAHKRRLIPIVDRRFQFKYTVLIVLIAALVSTLLGYLLLRAYQEMNAIIQISEEIGERLNADDARFVFQLSIGFLVGEVFILGIMGLLITHRVCGPIFVVQRHLATMLDGTYPNVRSLRAGDEFRDMFQNFSDVVDELRKRDQDEHERLKSVLATAQAKGLGDAEVAVLRQLVDERAARLATAPPRQNAGA